MKIDPKFVAKLAGTLLVISLVVAALLGVVNGITAEKIAAINAENTAIAMNAVVTVENAEFNPLEAGDALVAAAAPYGKLDSIYEVKDGGNVVGYTVKVIASGSQGSIEMIVGVDSALAVTGVSVVDHSETSGIGTKVTGNVDAISGATVSSKGVTSGVNAALAAVEALG